MAARFERPPEEERNGYSYGWNGVLVTGVVGNGGWSWLFPFNVWYDEI